MWAFILTAKENKIVSMYVWTFSLTIVALDFKVEISCLLTRFYVVLLSTPNLLLSFSKTYSKGEYQLAAVSSGQMSVKN